MSTSAINDLRRKLRRAAWCALGLSALCVATDRIYALFAHEARSPYMTWMFLLPLIGGTVLFEALGLAARRYLPGRFRLGLNLYGSGLATLTVGCFFRGILEIANSTSAYVPAFFAAGLVLSVGGLAAMLSACLGQRDAPKPARSGFPPQPGARRRPGQRNPRPRTTQNPDARAARWPEPDSKPARAGHRARREP